MNNELKLQIKNTIENSINNFFRDKKIEVSHVLDLLFPQERRIRSLIGGLETSFGTTVWEPIAKILASNNGFEILDKKDFLMPTKMPEEVLSLISHWEEKRKDRENEVELSEYVSDLKYEILNLNITAEELKFQKLTPGKGIDLWLKKNETEYIYDIKTNQVNQNGGLSLNRNLMDWYAYRILKNPELNIKAQIAFPFNPFYPKTWWEKQGKRIYPLQENLDAVVENNFWNFLSGEPNTWTNILSIFEELKSENFSQKFHDIFYL